MVDLTRLLGRQPANGKQKEKQSNYLGEISDTAILHQTIIATEESEINIRSKERQIGRA